MGAFVAPYLAILVGGVTGAALFLLFLALRGLPPAAEARPSRRDTLGQMVRFLSTRGSVAVIVGFVVLVVTRWPVAAVGAGALVLAWKGISGGAAGERAAMRRLEALASWTESLRDTIAGAVGLEQAIPASVRAAAPVLQPHLQMLVDRLHTRMPLPQALQRFADDLGDPSADLVVAALILNARLRGPGLRQLLGALAGSAREELDMRRRVEANRRSTRRSVQIVMGVTLGVAGLLVVFNRPYVAEYDGFLGQLVLIVVLAMFAAGFVWLKRLARFDTPSRLLTASSGSPASEEGQAPPAAPSGPRPDPRGEIGGAG